MVENPVIAELCITRIQRCRSDVEFFLTEFFPQHFTKPFAPFHKEIFRALGNNPRLVIGAPRGHGKSEIVSFGWVMWNLLCNPNCHFVIIISNNYANACRYLRAIKDEFENNKELISAFGEQKSDKWSENEIEIVMKKKVLVGGNEFKIRGQKYLQYRPDLIVIDDAEDDELVESEERRDKFEHWLLYGLEPALNAEHNSIVMIGTVLHRACQLSKLLEGGGKYEDWQALKYMAITDGKALWPEHRDLEWLEAEREKDPYRFSQEYMNNPVPYDHAMFKPEYFDNYTKDKLPRELLVNITVDLACTDKTYSDYTVILPCGIDAYGDMWVLPYVRGKYTDPDKIYDELFKLCKYYLEHSHHKLGKVGIESVAFQRFFLKNFNRERKIRGLRFPVFEIKAKGDKVTRIAQLQPFFAAGDIHVRHDMKELRQELLDFPKAIHDDISDALCMSLDFISRKPIVKKEIIAGFFVTPEKQRQKFLLKQVLSFRPKTYTNFQGL